MSLDNSDLSKLLSSATIVFIGLIFSSFAILIERIIVGRFLSPASYGDFNIALAIFMFAATLGTAGFKQGVPRYMARFDNQEDIRGAWLTGLVVSGSLSLVVALVLLVFSPFFISYLFEFDKAGLLLLVFVVAMPLYVILTINIGAIRGHENTLYKSLSYDVFYPFTRISFIGLLLFFGFGLIGTGIGYLMSIAFSVILTSVLLNRISPLTGQYQFHTRKMVSFSVPLVISSIISILLTRTDTLMLGYFRSSIEVGIYNAAQPLAVGLTVILGAFGYMYLPLVSRLDAERESSIERVYEITTKWNYVMIFPLFVLFITHSDDIISIAFGPQYRGAGSALTILSLGFFTSAAMGQNQDTLSALGATKFILYSNIIAFCLNVLLNFILIPAYGFRGAAVASAMSYLTLNFMMYLFLKYRFEVTPFNWQSTKTYVILPLVIIPIGFVFNNIMGGGSLGIVIVAVAIGILTISLVLIIGGLEPEDMVFVEFIENITNTRIPFIRSLLPNE